jgi:hypothetical protein
MGFTGMAMSGMRLAKPQAKLNPVLPSLRFKDLKNRMSFLS